MKQHTLLEEFLFEKNPQDFQLSIIVRSKQQKTKNSNFDQQVFIVVPLFELPLTTSKKIVLVECFDDG